MVGQADRFLVWSARTCGPRTALLLPAEHGLSVVLFLRLWTIGTSLRLWTVLGEGSLWPQAAHT